MGRSMSGLMIVGALLVLFGLVGFAIPIFTTNHTEDVAKVGSVKIQTTEHDTHVIPPLVAGGAIALGVVLLGVGMVQRR